jgi:hypothetical protein
MAMRTIRTPKRRKAFLAKLAEHGNVETACREAGMGKSAAYKWKREAPDFSDEWDAVIDEFLDREVESVRVSLIEQAKKGDTVAAIFLLRHHLPQIYNPNLLLRREALKLEIEQRRRALAGDSPTGDAPQHGVIDGEEVQVINRVMFALPPNNRDKRKAAALVEDATDATDAA